MSDDDHTHFTMQADARSGHPYSTLPAGTTPLGVEQIPVSTDLNFSLPTLPGEAQIVANILGETLEAFIATLAEKPL